MKTTKALKFKVSNPNIGKAKGLDLTQRRFRRAVNFYLDKIFKDPSIISNKNLPDVYGEAKKIFDLPTALLQQAGRFAIEQYKAYKENEDNPHFSHFDSFVPVRYDNRTMTVFEGTDTGYDLWFSLATPNGRQVVPIEGGEKYIQEWKQNNFKFQDARLQRQGDDYYVIVHVSKEVDIPEEEEFEHFIGVDLGLNNLATVVVQDRDGNVLESKFFDGGYVGEKRNKFRDKRSEYQSKGLNQKLAESKGKETRFMKDVDHKISRQIIDIAKKYDNAVVVLEKLDGIREGNNLSKKQNRRVHNWTFAQLQEFIEYKAHASGIAYRKVPSYKTSSICTTCGHKAIRRSSSNAEVGVCQQCKKDVNAVDFLGAINIVRRLFFYIGGQLGPRGSGPDLGCDETEGCLATGEELFRHQMRQSIPRSPLQTEAIA